MQKVKLLAGVDCAGMEASERERRQASNIRQQRKSCPLSAFPPHSLAAAEHAKTMMDAAAAEAAAAAKFTRAVVLYERVRALCIAICLPFLCVCQRSATTVLEAAAAPAELTLLSLVWWLAASGTEELRD